MTYSMFGASTSQLSARMKAAEYALMSFANKFGHTNSHQAENIANETHTIELFDTKIPKSVVPLKSSKLKCLLYGKGKKCQEDELIMHGVKVTSKVYQSDGSSGSKTPLVLLHGYANGALYFYRNLFGLSSKHFGGVVYALDLLGWGLSSRPPFNIKNPSDDEDETEIAENFFVESLEAWRKAHDIPKITLAGHSMGGYLSVAYCEKYPQNVDRLILLSPAGVPHDKEDNSRFENLPLRFKLMFGMAKFLWNRGTTPSSFVRSLPESRGKSLVGRYVEGRLPAITCPDERTHLTEYLYVNAALPPSGEDCLNKILKPLAKARKPTVYRIPNLKVKHVAFIYGEHDWMDYEGGLEVERICRKLKQCGEFEVPSVEVLAVKKAGHLLMLENWEEFNSAVIVAGGGGDKLHPYSPKPSFFQQSDVIRSEFFERQKIRKENPAKI